MSSTRSPTVPSSADLTGRPGPADPGARTAPPDRPAPIPGGRLRAVWRLPALAGWTLACFLVWGAVSLLLLPFPRWQLRWRHRVTRGWTRGLAAIFGMHRTVRGPAPRPPFLLVSNHLSYLDIVLLLTSVDGVFVAKHDMRAWPLLGPLAHLAGTIWVRREIRRDAVRVLDQMDEALARGDGVLLFPEGTTSGGAGVLPLRPALLDWAAREQFPVHYAALSYQTPPHAPPADQVVCWWGTMPFGGHLLNLLRLREFEALVEFGPEPVRAPTRGELASRLQQAMAASFTPSGRTRT